MFNRNITPTPISFINAYPRIAAMPKPKVIITTEKDATRLEHLDGLSEETQSNIYALPIRIQFMLGGEEEFNNKIISYVRKNY
jgi:tetraacyldisaccharide 4'-kinase